MGNAAFPHGHSFRPRRRNFPELRLSAFGIFFERPLMSRSAHSYKPLKAGKNHLLSAHPLENQTQNKHLQCVRMLWNVRKGLPSQEWAPPSPSGESGLGLEGALWLWAPGALQAERITATLVSTRLAAWQLLAQLLLPPPKGLLSAPGFPLSLTALLSPPERQISESPRTRSLCLCLSPTSIQFLRGSLQLPSF